MPSKADVDALLEKSLKAAGCKTVMRGIYDPEQQQTPPATGYPLASYFDEPKRYTNGATGGRIHDGTYGVMIWLTGNTKQKVSKGGRGLAEVDAFFDNLCDVIDIQILPPQHGVMKLEPVDSVPYWWMEEIAIGGLIRIAYNYSRTPPATGATQIGPMNILND